MQLVALVATTSQLLGGRNGAYGTNGHQAGGHQTGHQNSGLGSLTRDPFGGPAIDFSYTYI